MPTKEVVHCGVLCPLLVSCTEYGAGTVMSVLIKSTPSGGNSLRVPGECYL